MNLGLFRLVFFAALSVSCAHIPRAADKSGVSPNTISLPKGPGSIEGLGESFQPTLNTGTAKYAIKLLVPPGTAGHAPSLSLQYEGGGGNSILGFGWTPPAIYIQRRTDKGIPTYGQNVGFPREDSFINEMKEELIPTADGFFFCKNEGPFIRYQQLGEHWVAKTPDGTRMEFGPTPQSRIQDDRNRVFSWMLEREIDTHGNTIVYSYQSFSGEHNTNQIYLTGIRYGPGAPPWTNFHFITLQYEDRLDWFEDCRPGFVVRTGKRLRSIIVGTQGPALAGHLRGDFDGDGQADNLVRRYDLEYLRYSSSVSHWSLLANVTQVGADGVGKLPPAGFGYEVCDPPAEISAAGNVIGSVNGPPFVMDNPLVDLIDLNGDGLPDILKTDSGGGFHTAYINDGEVKNGDARTIRWKNGLDMAGDPAASGFNLGSDAVHLADMDGNGLADFAVKAGADNVFYFANGGKLNWRGRKQMSVQSFPPPAPFGTAGVRTADIDFDKRVDIIRSLGGNLGYHVWFNLGNDTFSERVLAEPENGFSFDFSLASAQIADLNGDRVPDVGWIRPTSVMVTAGLGYGRFTGAIRITLPADTVLSEQQIGHAKLTDITGDGLADLVIERAEGTDLWYWINLGTYAFSERRRITGLPAPTGLRPEVRWADLNGNGTSDYVLADRESFPSIQTVDVGDLILRGSAPNLLTMISNGIGRVTLIGYESSTKFRLADEAAGVPWPDPMPFPVQVVAAVTNLDSLGHSYVTQFRYHDGYYDPLEKQFRGFARVEQVDLGDPTAPTLVTRSHFDTGREFESMKGKLLRVTVAQDDGKVFWDQVTAWTFPPRTLMVGTNGTNISYVHPTARKKTIKGLGQGTERRLEAELDYDRFGNQVLEANYGVVENGDRLVFNDERITRTEYALNLESWIVRHPKRQETLDGKGMVISRAELFYDDETFSGGNLGQVVIGNLTLKREWIDPAKPEAFTDSVRSKYDPFGNPVVFLDPLAVAPVGKIELASGHVREIKYDPLFRTYPITETIHVGNGSTALLMQAEYDDGFGRITASIDFNANRTIYGYDAFARLVNIVKPGDSTEFPTVEYDYVLGQPVGTDGLVNFIETRQLDREPGSAGADKRSYYFTSRHFVDGLGRKLMSKEEGDTDPVTGRVRVVVKEATLFNARQQPTVTLNPFYSLASGVGLDSLLAFEGIEAPGWKGSFSENGKEVPLDLAKAHRNSTAYDAALRELQATNPDGTFRRKIYEPLAEKSYDEEDVNRESPHFDTPMVHYHDGLGRLIRVDEVVRLNDDGTPRADLKTWTTGYEYDANDQLTHIIDSQSNEKFFRYDGLKRKTFMDDPDRGHMAWIYDDASNLKETIDAKEQHIVYTYDGVNRLLTEDYLDGKPPPPWRESRSPVAADVRRLTSSGAQRQKLLTSLPSNAVDVIYHYDIPFTNLDAGDTTFVTPTNTKGMLAWLEDLSGEEHTSYDARGRAEYVVKRIPDLEFLGMSNVPRSSYLVSYKTAFKYNSLDRVTKLTYPDNDEISYRYNPRNLLETIVGGVNGLTGNGNVIEKVLYRPSAQLEAITYGNGVTSRYVYDPRLRLIEIDTSHAEHGSELVHFGYQFDDASNIEIIEDRRSSTAVPEGDLRRNTQLFQYDDLYRIKRAQYSFNLPKQAIRNDGYISYRYDRVGNMLEQTSNIVHNEKGLPVVDLGLMESGGSAGRFNRSGRKTSDPPGPHALSQISNFKSSIPVRAYRYDANGNMLNIDGLTNTWDFKDRLIAVEDANLRAEYLYDYTDRRITKKVIQRTAANAVAEFVNPGETLTTIYVDKYFEVRENDAPTKYVWNGNSRVAQVTGSLSTNGRVQRLRLWPNWNLVSLAITTKILLQQSNSASITGGSQLQTVQSAFKWHSPTQSWLVVENDELLASGTILWLKCRTNSTIKLIGSYTDPIHRTLPAGISCEPSAGLEVWQLTDAPPTNLRAWAFQGLDKCWRVSYDPNLSARSDVPPFLSPGEAFIARNESSMLLEVVESKLRIRYYHQDHLGSSAVLSDSHGEPVAETAFYPFGSRRYGFQRRGLHQAYDFTQKEMDEESRLIYFEARYLFSGIGRFTSVDPMAVIPDGRSLRTVSELHPYLYAGAKPLSHRDPTGQFVIAIPLLTEAALIAAKGTVYVLSAIAAGAAVHQSTKQGAQKESFSLSDDDFVIVGGNKSWPKSPWQDKTRPPSEIAKDLRDEMKKTAEQNRKSANNKLAQENRKIQEMHDRYIKTGEWRWEKSDPNETPDLPDEGLRKARENYKRGEQNQKAREDRQNERKQEDNTGERP